MSRKAKPVIIPILILGAIIFITSCASTSHNNLLQSNFQPVNDIPENVSVIHFYRKARFAGSAVTAVIINKQSVELLTELRNKNRYSMLIGTDNLNIVVKAKLGKKLFVPREYPFELKGGVEYYIEILPLVAGGFDAVLKSKDIGITEINKCITLPGVVPIEKRLADYRDKMSEPVQDEKIVSTDSPKEAGETIRDNEILKLGDKYLKLFGNYHALVIGNNNYTNIPKLETAINDAKEVAKILQDNYLFDVNLLLDATRADILMAFNEYRKKLTENDNLLIYYAGHGWLDEAADEGYWLPVDADKDNSINWISNNTITSELRAMQAKHVMVVSDSCYSGKLTRGLNITNRTPDYLIRMAEKRTRVVMSSGGLEPVMDTSFNKEHSVFAIALIEALASNNEIVDTTTLFSKIRRPVMLNSDQTPEYGDIRKAGHEGGDFIFLHKNAFTD